MHGGHSGYAHGNGVDDVLGVDERDRTNQVWGRALRNKTLTYVYKFLLEDAIYRYGWVGKIVADKGELDANEA